MLNPKINYIIGDATLPIKRPALIIHCCNSIGGWGAGFVVALSRRHKEPERAYREWFKTGSPRLGECQIVPVKHDLWVANIIGQEGIGADVRGRPPIRYNALQQGLAKAFKFAFENNLTVHGPKLGSDRAGGTWAEIEKLIQYTMNVETYIYTLGKP